MTTLPRFSVRNPVLVNLFMVAILIGGVYCAMTLVREMFPESRPNRIMITTLYPGATPAEVEKGITLKIEEQIKDVDGVERILSTITEGRSLIVAEMRSGFSRIDQAVNDVKAAIDTIPPEDFPQDALQTQVAKFEPRFPVISVSLYGDCDDRTLKTLGERLRQDVLALPGVTEALLSGTRKDEISVEVAPGKLAEFGLSFTDVAEAIAANNLDLPGGQVRTATANVAVRTLGEKDQGDQLYDIVIHSDRQGRAVHVKDVATIVDGFEDVDISGRLDGFPAVSVTVYKTPDQDAIEIAGMVKALAAGIMGRPLERSWNERLLAMIRAEDPVEKVYDKARSHPYPAGVGVKTRMDLSPLIKDRLELMERNGVWGLMLVFLSLLVFLHWRVAFWVMMGLVLAIAGSLICMKLLGQTLNLMTAGGFIIVLGLLVDDAIIVSEHVYSKVQHGVEPKLAAMTGAEEVTWPVVCAIVTTIVAFAPLRFIHGQIGDWIGVLPVIVCVALSVSLLEALTILPSHLAHSLHPVGGRLAGVAKAGKLRSPAIVERFHGMQNRLQDRLVNVYERWLRRATSYRYVTVGALVSCLLIVGGTVLGGHVPWVLLQKIDSEIVMVNIKMGVGTPAKASTEAASVVERTVLGLEGVKSVYTIIGLQVTEDGKVSPPQSNLAQLWIELIPSDQRQRSSDDLIQEMRAKAGNIPGVEKLRFVALQGGPGGEPINLTIRGDRVEDLVKVSSLIQQELSRFDGVVDITDDFDAGNPEVKIELFESARALGLTTRSLATQVRAAFYGFEARKVQRGREDVKIMVRYPPHCRKHIYDIESMRVATPSGTLAPFTEVARLTQGTGYASIKRIDQQRTITVTADIDQNVTNSGQVRAALARKFQDIRRQFPGVDLEFAGEELEMAKAFGSLKQNFAIALTLIFVILAGLFRSYVQPLIVMAVIPFGIIGAVIGHFVMGYPLTIASRVGIVALTGVVVNDALILVTFINRRIEDGQDVHQAVIDGGTGRLRPILLTSLTTVLGMAPLLLETSFQAKFLIPMGIALSAGLMFATVLTLVAVPSFYLIVYDAKHILAGLKGWFLGRPVTGITGG